ncbi:MAG: hypothetical protein KatS3mg129_0401 [Leptospiraceae bacterium]|nr:MAG: hypothetical protein KatS3mg129_0401 [Leptospiraceae bacterium]
MRNILFIILFFLYFLYHIDILKHYYFDFGDIALISLKVEFAKEFKELLGPYSRMGFFHPGPIVFYLYAIMHKIFYPLFKILNFQSISAYYYLYQFIINFIVLIFTFIAFPKNIKHIGMIFLLIYLIFWENLNPIPFSMIFDIWGPSIIILPFLLLMVSLATFSIDSSKYYLLFFISFAISLIIIPKQLEISDKERKSS